jgi:hypothetical protein
VSCSRSTKFSAIWEGRFDSVAIFVRAATSFRTKEPKTASEMRCMDMVGGHSVAFLQETRSDRLHHLFANGLNNISGGSLDELTIGASRSAGHPLTGMLRYNKDSVRGDSRRKMR